jgi:hypothetical protein
MRKHSKKLAVAAAAISVLIAGGVAFAYFTNSGSGSGSATVGTSAAIQLSADLVGTLYPAGADVPVTVNIHNPGSGSQFVGTISGSVETQGACLGTWFEVDPIAYDATLAHGASDTAPTAVRMLDSHSNQDACKDLTMVLDFTSN